MLPNGTVLSCRVSTVWICARVVRHIIPIIPINSIFFIIISPFIFLSSVFRLQSSASQRKDGRGQMTDFSRRPPSVFYRPYSVLCLTVRRLHRPRRHPPRRRRRPRQFRPRLRSPAVPPATRPIAPSNHRKSPLTREIAQPGCPRQNRN